MAGAAVRASIGDVDTLDGQRAVLEALVQETEKVGMLLFQAGAGRGGVGWVWVGFDRMSASVSRGFMTSGVTFGKLRVMIGAFVWWR